MTDHEFDQVYWESHWSAESHQPLGRQAPVNPFLPAETIDLPRGTVLDAGCGTGTEALWLAEQGWEVTGADISVSALARAAARAEAAGLAERVDWVQADLTSWEPGRDWNLVVTSYAHPATGQLSFYRHIAPWVAPGGTLLIVAHNHDRHGGHADQQGRRRGDGTGQGHPEHATATASAITGLFTGRDWRIDASYEKTRTVPLGGGAVELNDVVVRIRRST